MGQFLRIVLILVGLWLIIRLIKTFLAAQKAARAPTRPARMLPCAHCGVYLPRAEGYETHGRFYCCRAHSVTDHKP